MSLNVVRTIVPLGFQAILVLLANLCKLGTSNMAVHTATKRSNMAILLLLANLCKFGISTMVVHTATKRSNMDNIISPLRIQWEVTKRGTTLCVAECSNDPECNSVFYNKVTKKCQGHSVTFGLIDNHMTGQSDTRYYVPSRGHGYIMDTCTVDVDCKVPNSTCWESRQCMCIPGYSFSPSSRQCVYPCSQFGPLFMKYADSFVHTNNLEKFNNIPLEDCYTLCRNRTSFTCRSVEYMGNDCILSNVTAKDSVVIFARDAAREYDVSYHQRDCA